MLLAALCLDADPAELAATLTGAAELKETLTTAVNDLLAPIRARRAGLAQDPGYVRAVLRKGNEHANDIAADTLGEVRAAMGMHY